MVRCGDSYVSARTSALPHATLDDVPGDADARDVTHGIERCIQVHLRDHREIADGVDELRERSIVVHVRGLFRQHRHQPYASQIADSDTPDIGDGPTHTVIDDRRADSRRQAPSMDVSQMPMRWARSSRW
jgi:hypothetical protein